MNKKTCHICQKPIIENLCYLHNSCINTRYKTKPKIEPTINNKITIEKETIPIIKVSYNPNDTVIYI